MIQWPHHRIEIVKTPVDIAKEFKSVADDLTNLVISLERVVSAADEPVDTSLLKILYECRDVALECHSKLHEICFRFDVKRGIY